jgi:FAD/FMN-containing dehydrogenase
MDRHQPFIDVLKSGMAGDVLSDRHSLGMYATDASVYQIGPIAIVLPKNTDDVEAALKAARDHAISILPRGGGTSLAGQTVGHSMILDFSKYMNTVLELNE